MPTKKAVTLTSETKPVRVKKTSKKAPITLNQSISEASSEKLVVENFTALSQVITSMTETLDMLVQKAESMAFHIIATEEILGEIIADNGLNIAQVNARIRAKLTTGPNSVSDANNVIDVAASIASPLPRR